MGPVATSTRLPPTFAARKADTNAALPVGAGGHGSVLVAVTCVPAVSEVGAKAIAPVAPPPDATLINWASAEETALVPPAMLMPVSGPGGVGEAKVLS